MNYNPVSFSSLNSPELFSIPVGHFAYPIGLALKHQAGSETPGRP